MKIIIMGAPGAGKGTHAKEITKRYQIPHISTGDILREEVQKNTMLGKTARTYMDDGKLVPDDIIIRIIHNRIKENDCRTGYLFDGFPRNLVQAEKLDQITELDAVISLKCPDDLIIKRLTGRRMTEDGKIYNVYFDPPPEGVKVFQRDDDNEETIKQRLKIFYNTFTPLMDFYKEKGIFFEIRGDEEREVVLGNIFNILESI